MSEHNDRSAGSDRALLATLVHDAMRFALWAAGEGISPVDGQPARAPEDFLYEYSCAADIEDWEGLAEVARDAVMPAPAQPAPATRQYYYRMNGCKAHDSESPDCICWHDEGTGPRSDEAALIVNWREKPAASQPSPAATVEPFDVMATIDPDHAESFERHNGSSAGTSDVVNRLIARGYLREDAEDIAKESGDAGCGAAVITPWAVDEPHADSGSLTCANCKSKLDEKDSPLVCGMCREMGAAPSLIQRATELLDEADQLISREGASDDARAVANVLANGIEDLLKAMRGKRYAMPAQPQSSSMTEAMGEIVNRAGNFMDADAGEWMPSIYKIACEAVGVDPWPMLEANGWRRDQLTVSVTRPQRK